MRVWDLESLEHRELEYRLDDVSHVERRRWCVPGAELLAELADIILGDFGHHALLEARIDIAVVNATPHRLGAVGKVGFLEPIFGVGAKGLGLMARSFSLRLTWTGDSPRSMALCASSHFSRASASVRLRGL